LSVDACEAFDLVEVTGDVFAGSDRFDLMQEAPSFFVLVLSDEILGVFGEGADFVLFA
jgi:hypothetical protein